MTYMVSNLFDKMLLFIELIDTNKPTIKNLKSLV
jgi:hypothetical protein